METPERIRNALAYATGSEKVWRLFRNRDDFFITEGVMVMADMTEAWWLLTAIASYCLTDPNVREESFTDWTLTLDGTKAHLTGGDGDDRTLVEQEIPYTDFPLPEGITLFKVDDVLMLPSEY